MGTIIALLKSLLGLHQPQPATASTRQLPPRVYRRAQVGDWVYVYDDRLGWTWVQVSARLSNGRYWVTDNFYTWELLPSEVYDVRISPPQ